MKRILISLALVTLLLIPELSCTNNLPSVAPDKDTIAIILGKKIDIKEKDKLNGLIFGTLLEQYAKENKIEPTESELDAFIHKMEEIEREMKVKDETDRINLIEELKSPSLTEEERRAKSSRLEIIEKTLGLHEQTKTMDKEMLAMKRDVAQHVVKTWKTNKSLYEKYGGRIIFQQAGIEPLDAYREFLEEQEKKGSFRIYNKDYEASFWAYFKKDSKHNYYSGDDGAKFMKTPWWLMDEPM